MLLQVEIAERAGGNFSVHLKGRLDTSTYASCEEQLAPVIAAQPALLLLQLANLDYISSMGLRVVMATRKAVEKAGGAVVIAEMQPQIKKIFEIANVVPMAALFETIEDADSYLDSLQKDEPGEEGKGGGG